jgi:hypothetical protein
MRVVAFLKQHFLALFFVLFSFVYGLQIYKIGSNYNRFNKVINEDAFGYYIILPAFFQYQDPNFEFIDTVLRQSEDYENYVPPVINPTDNGKKVCKYYSGVAILQAPFYLVNSILFETKKTETGFQISNHFTILVASAFYLLLGIWGMIDVLKNLKITPLLIASAVSLTLFGSNLLTYATYDIAYSHVYSFFALVFFIRAIYLFKHKPNLTTALLCGFFFGLIVIIRPLNGISVLFIPIIFGLKPFIQLFKNPQFKFTVIGIVSAILVLSLQSLIWHWQTGLWYVYPYGSESLNLAKPQLSELIFGFNCGWAIYTPVPFIALLISLFFFFFKHQFRQGIWMFVCSFTLLYLLSSWYYLHYGCTVGCRPITEFYGPLFIAFAYSANSLMKSKWSKIILLLFTSIGIKYNLIVQHQFFENIINWCEMDKERFQMVFLKTHEAYKYATSPFWDFSRFNQAPPLKLIPLNKKLSIGSEKTDDRIQVQLPELEAKDSSLLFDLKIKGTMFDEINDSYLRILINDNGEYIELLNLLLRRKISTYGTEQTFIYQFHVSKSIKNPLLNISLESVNNKAVCELKLEELEIKRVNL